MIIFIDVDGTLVDYENNLPNSAVEAIRKARRRGHFVFICTGRSTAEVYPEIWDIGLDGMIGGNGSYVECHGDVIFHQTLSYNECVEIVDWLHEKQLEFYLESNAGLFASEQFETKAIPTIREYSKRKAFGDENLSVRDVFPTMKFGEKLYRGDINKISYILSSYQDYIDTSERFPMLKHGTWGGAGETALFGDVGVKDISKAHAIDVLLEHLGETKEQTIAFGDAKIDIPMFECCSYSVAMGNSSNEIKLAANMVTDDVNHDGLKKAFEKLGLI